MVAWLLSNMPVRWIGGCLEGSTAGKVLKALIFFLYLVVNETQDTNGPQDALHLIES